MMQAPVITSRENPVIRQYRRICESKKYRRTEQCFAAEGLRLVREALQEGVCGTVLLTETAEERFGAALELPEGCRLVRITDALGAYISETEHPQGVFALCRMPQMQPAPQMLRPDGRYLVLCGLQDPGNMGMILRTADAFGVDAVLCCRSCEVHSPKTVRAAMGAVFRLPVYETAEPAALAELLRGAGIRSYAAILDERAVRLPDCALGHGCAVWIGNEGSGLTAEEAAACDGSVMIPMQGHAESLNAAMAAGILMWEMMKGEGSSDGK